MPFSRPHLALVVACSIKAIYVNKCALQGTSTFHFRKTLVYYTFEQYSFCHRHAACVRDHLPPHWEGAESDDTRELRALDGRTLCRTAWQRMHCARGRGHLRPHGAGGDLRSWGLLQQGGHCKHPSSPTRGFQASRQRRDGANLTPGFTIMAQTPHEGRAFEGGDPRQASHCHQGCHREKSSECMEEIL